jgi:hypothetical protein
MTAKRIKNAENIVLGLYIVCLGLYAGSGSGGWIILTIGSFLYCAAVVVLEHLKKAKNSSSPKP